MQQNIPLFSDGQQRDKHVAVLGLAVPRVGDVEVEVVVADDGQLLQPQARHVHHPVPVAPADVRRVSCPSYS